MPKVNKQPLASIVGANIVAFRQAKGWTQIELAQKAGMAADYLSRIERGFVAPRFNRIEKLAQLLGCAPAELFRAEGYVEPTEVPITREQEVRRLAERIVSLLHDTPGDG